MSFCEWKEIRAQRVLSPTQISLADAVINPYRGCQFDCVYCYARKAHSAGSRRACVEAKINAPELLTRELRMRRPRRVLLGSTTECFQYAEARFRLTEKILKILDRYGIPVTILTKSHLIRSCLPLLSRNRENRIFFTFNLSSNHHIRALEGASPHLHHRIDTLAEILRFGISLRVHAGPFFPFLSSLDTILRLLPKGVKEIDVELYHPIQGNFLQVGERIEQIRERAAAQKMKEIYAAKHRYDSFAADQAVRMRALNRRTGLRLYLIVPEFRRFYDRSLTYQNPLAGGLPGDTPG
ncbi:MAG: hypothetical protein GF333_05885 [Candidatus Omnitrophica bacterium]|nr:hypothetical protein [Candidatus Omnitrophota bacterium]